MNKILKITIAVVLCLIVILAVVLLATQCSSNSNSPENSTAPTTSTTTSSTPTPTTPVVPECTEHVDGNNDYICDNCEAQLEKPSCTEHVDANNDYICDNCEAQLERPTVDVFVETNDKVYVITESLNIRSSASADSNDNKVGWAQTDNELERIGYYSEGANAGWSKIRYNDQECFIKTSNVTTQKPIVIVDGEPETVYLTMNILCYKKPSMISGYSPEEDWLYKGTEIIRLGVATEVYADGEITFAKVKFIDSEGNEVIAYVDNDALTTEAPTAPNPDGEVVFESSTKVLVSVYAKNQKFNLRVSTNMDDPIADELPGQTVLQAIGYGVEADETEWFKVLYEGNVYYVIYKSKTGTHFTLYDSMDDVPADILGA